MEIVSRKRDDENRIGRRDAETHDRAHQRRDAGGGDRQMQRPDHAGERARQRRNDDERIKPTLEVHDQQQIDQRNGHHQADGSAR